LLAELHKMVEMS